MFAPAGPPDIEHGTLSLNAGVAGRGHEMTIPLHGRSRLSQISVISRKEEAAAPLTHAQRGGDRASLLEPEAAPHGGKA